MIFVQQTEEELDDCGNVPTCDLGACDSYIRKRLSHFLPGNNPGTGFQKEIQLLAEEMHE